MVKKFIFAVLFSVFCYGFWWCSMNYAGYCHAEGKFLTDREKIESGAEFALNGYPPSIQFSRIDIVNGHYQEKTYWKTPKNFIRYSGMPDFFSKNPDCCWLSKVAGEGLSHSWIERITGEFSDFVIIKYKVIYQEDGQEKYGTKNMAVSITNCGKTWSMF